MQWRPSQRIRPISIALVRRNSDILVVAVKDGRGVIKGWRPPGGGIEFGESAEDAVKREFMEELGQPIRCTKRLCVVENVYVHEEVRGHEIVFVFEARFTDPSAYERDHYVFVDGGVESEGSWKRCEEFLVRAEKLFPDELSQYLVTAFDDTLRDGGAA
jgi:ADP-ribose pyrophosphatase YjhB (NUDIX family)